MKHEILFYAASIGLVLLSSGCLQTEKVSAAELDPALAKESASLGSSMATGPRTGYRDPVEKWAAVLNLTDVQKEQIREALPPRPQFKKNRGKFRHSGGNFKEMQDMRKARMEQMYQSLKPILTPEQLVIAEEIHGSLQNGIVPQAFVEYRLTRMTQNLGLNEEQQNSLRPLILKMEQDKLKAKTEASSFEEFKTAGRQSRIAFRESMATLLTQEQYAEFKSHKQKGGKGFGQGGGECFR